MWVALGKGEIPYKRKKLKNMAWDRDRTESIKALFPLTRLLPSLSPHRGGRDKWSADCPKCGGLGKLWIIRDKRAVCFHSGCEWGQTNVWGVKGVDAVDIYRDIRGLSHLPLLEVLQIMEKEAGLGEVEESGPSLLERVMEEYQYQLTLPGGAEAISYMRGRGWKEELIKDLGVGYTPHARCLRENSFSQAELLRGNLLSPDGGEYFRNHLVFPVRNLGGRIVYLMGRCLGTPLEGLPKWKHQRGSSSTKYLLQEDRIPEYRKEKWLLLCEGMPDTITACGLNLPAVGTAGLEGICNHVDKFQGFSYLIAAYDGDRFPENHKTRAGEYKSWSMVLPQLIDLQILLPHMRVYVWFVPTVGKIGDSVFSQVKDLNEYVLTSGIDGRELREEIWKNKRELIEYLGEIWGADPAKHLALLRLCAATGRGREYLMEKMNISEETLLWGLQVFQS